MAQRKPRLETRKTGSYFRYLLGGEPIPSVTQILGVINKEALVPWAKKVTLEAVEGYLKQLLGQTLTLSDDTIGMIISESRRASDTVKNVAADLGKQTHALIEEHLRTGKVPDVPAELKPAFDSFLEWKKTNPFEVVSLEHAVYSEKHWYAGTFDLLGRDHQGLFVADFKTGSGVYNESPMQIAAYAEAFRETSGQKISRGLILWLSKNPPAQFKPFECVDLDKSFESFLAAKELREEMRSENFRETATTTAGKAASW